MVIVVREDEADYRNRRHIFADRLDHGEQPTGSREPLPTD